MATSAKYVRIAGEDYLLPDLFVLSQLRDISVRTMQKASGSDLAALEGDMLQQSVDIIEIALRKSDRAIKAADILEMKTNFSEVIQARNDILQHANLVKIDGGDSKGEGVAGR